MKTDPLQGKRFFFFWFLRDKIIWGKVPVTEETCLNQQQGTVRSNMPEPLSQSYTHIQCKSHDHWINPLIAHRIYNLLLHTSLSYRVALLSCIVSLHMLCPLAAPAVDSNFNCNKEAVEKEYLIRILFLGQILYYWFRRKGKKLEQYQIILDCADTESNTNKSVVCYAILHATQRNFNIFPGCQNIVHLILILVVLGH